MAKSLLKQYDPTGALTKNLTYSYNAGSLNESVAEYLQSQWKTNLGINVSLNSVSDASIFISNRLSGNVVSAAIVTGVSLEQLEVSQSPHR
jgi:ABC-type oligopeptide transport system substrate-binding subunit